MTLRRVDWVLRPVAAAVMVGLLVFGSVPAVMAGDGQNELVSRTPAGLHGNDHSGPSVISGDGRFIAFASNSSDLVPGDTNGVVDVFVRDRKTGITTRVSVTSSGLQANGGSIPTGISADGRFVVFSSSASNLAPGDYIGDTNVFVHDRNTKTTKLVSATSNGLPGDWGSWAGAISANGRYIVFTSAATNLVPGDHNGLLDVYRYDQLTGEMRRVSVTASGAEGDSSSEHPSVSDDGSVTFSSASINFLPNPPHNPLMHPSQIFLKRSTGQLQLVSRKGGSGGPGGSSSYESSITPDGRYIAFLTWANLFPEPAAHQSRIYVHDITTGVTEKVSVNSAGVHANSSVRRPSISDDGRFVVFDTDASNLVSGDTHGTYDIFLRDLHTKQTTAVSIAAGGGLANGHSQEPVISGDGRHVSFGSGASDLVPGGTSSDDRQVFARQVLPNPHPGGTDHVGAFDPATGQWHLHDSRGWTTTFYFGDPGDIPFVGDWDGDGIDTPGLYRQSTGFGYLINSIPAHGSVKTADLTFWFGTVGDVPIVGDWDGDGKDTLSIYRQSEGRVYIINRLPGQGGSPVADFAYYFGTPGDKPFAGDFDADGKDTVGLHRESTGIVYFRNSHTTGEADNEFYFGNPGDRLIAGDWGIVDGVDTPGVFRPSSQTWYFRFSNSQGFAEHSFVWGHSRWLPVAGNWGLGD